ncbi:MAG TPA: cobalamin-dependent protein [Spirochaetota bacterium]|mgnify:CR=1 FL=1|nr:cobalamin-dependent protein [Spirochaetota bacterium]HPP51139.1 cobalamin-dependent protein [Spirochaetota bacterium]
MGANVPQQDIIEFVKEKKPHIVALSCTMTFHLHKIIETIKALRTIADTTPIYIIVGGYPFNIDTNLWKKVDADLYAPNTIKISESLSKIFIS